MTGFLATLTPEQQASAAAYRGDDTHGMRWVSWDGRASTRPRDDYSWVRHRNGEERLRPGNAHPLEWGEPDAQTEPKFDVVAFGYE